jgi:four helix bundle protein
MRDHFKLIAYKLADELAILIYKATRFFPKDEIYGLTSQLRRACVSVPSNIVEGCARTTQTEFCRFLDMAYGSLKELDYQFSLAIRLDYVNEQDQNVTVNKIVETEKVLSALIRKFRK